MHGTGRSDSPELTAGAEAAFASFVARVRAGEAVDFEAFCGDRPALADSLRALHAAWQASRAPESRPDVHSIRDFLSRRDKPTDTGIDLDEEAPADEIGSGIRERLTQLQSRTGRYALRNEVARGGMGVILKAWDKDLRRTLAMKVSLRGVKNLSEGELGPEATESVARFLDEAQITSQLDHPGIVPVHEIGIDNDGHMYFTMRLVKGHTLDEIIKLARADKGGWNRPRAIGVMVKVCEAMAYAHAKGVIHRDLKPANIMVGDYGEVYVMDWGLAKVIGGPDRYARSLEHDLSVMRSRVSTDRFEDLSRTPGSPLHTMEGTIVGTPTYMPPEQAQGKIDALDPRSDVYSVGALLYTLLTGWMPYVNPKELTSVDQVLLKLIDGPPDPILDIDRAVPAELVSICEKAMAREPDERYESMVGMAADLRAFVENRVVSAHQTGAVAEFRKWVGRNKAMAASLAALILVALTGSILVAWQQSSKYAEVSAAHKLTKEAEAEAVSNEKRALENAERARVNALRAERQSYFANLAAAHASLRMRETGDARRLLAACPERYRGWEWRFVDFATDTSVTRLQAHADGVRAVAVSADGSLIATGSEDRTVVLWDGESLERQIAWTESPDAITAIALSADGSRAAAASEGELVCVWDVGGGRLAGTCTHESLVTSLALSANGSLLVTGDDDGAHLWDALRCQRTATLVHDATVTAVAVSPDGATVVTGDEMGVHVWDAETAVKRWSVELAQGVTGIALTGTLLAVASPDEKIYLIDGKTGEVVRQLSGHADPVSSVAFAANGTRLVSASYDKTVCVWDTSKGRRIDVLQGHREPVLDVACAQGRIVSASADGTLRLWKLEAGGSSLTLPGDEDFLAAVAFSPDGRTVAAASFGHGEIRFWDSTTGATLDDRYIEEQGGALSSLAFGPDGTWLVAGGHGDATCRVHDAATGERLWTLRGHESSVTSVAVSRDGALIASASAGPEVRLWDPATGKAVGEPLEQEDRKIRVVSFGVGSRIAAGCDDGSVLLWGSPQDAEPRLLADHAGEIFAVCFSPDGKWLATAGKDKVVRIWEVESGEVRYRLEGHGDGVRGLAFNPEGTRLASASEDKTIRIWDMETGHSLLRIHAHEEWAVSVAFSPDGTQLASCSYDTTAKIWRTRPPG